LHVFNTHVCVRKTLFIHVLVDYAPPTVAFMLELISLVMTSVFIVIDEGKSGVYMKYAPCTCNISYFMTRVP
jgi:hypothetical protein